MLGSLCLLPGNARAAQSLDTCAGFIDTLPAVISTQGVWCLRHDLATSMPSGSAINISTNNVTIDCNDFKIGGLGAGNASTTYGIHAASRQNVTARHCNVCGFHTGIYVYGGAGHLVEDNRLDNNLAFGIFLSADNSLVQRNRVFDTGGFAGTYYSYGIFTVADTLENTVSGVFATATDTTPYGIAAHGSGTTVHGNRVRGLAVAGAGYATGIRLYCANSTADGNRSRHTSPRPVGASWGYY